jgi:hypothetical protein
MWNTLKKTNEGIGYHFRALLDFVLLRPAIQADVFVSAAVLAGGSAGGRCVGLGRCWTGER